jgi:hypothetical protein
MARFPLFVTRPLPLYLAYHSTAQTSVCHGVLHRVWFQLPGWLQVLSQVWDQDNQYRGRHQTISIGADTSHVQPQLSSDKGQASIDQLLEGCKLSDGGSVPGTGSGKPLLDDVLGEPTEVFNKYADAIFDALDASVEPKGTGAAVGSLRKLPPKSVVLPMGSANRVFHRQTPNSLVSKD